MINEAEFIGLNDKPALLAISAPEWLDAAKGVLAEIGYKVHAASNHDDFIVRFGRIQYQLVLMEELFAANARGELHAPLHPADAHGATAARGVHPVGQLLQHLEHPAGLPAQRARGGQSR
jgi:hypothetical protein